MQTSMHYVQLRAAYPDTTEGEPVEVTLAELAAILFCTERHVKNIVKKLAELEWIRWVPGRGRGNRSVLYFDRNVSDLILQEAKTLASKGELNEALALLRGTGADVGARESFASWLHDYFGFHTENVQDRRIDTLRFPMYAQVNSLDPADVFYAVDAYLISTIFDTLVLFDQKKQTFEPNLAHYWSANGDATIWTFYLRKGILFHHGREMTASDVMYTFERLKRGKDRWPNAWCVGEVAELRSVGKYAVEVRLTRPNYLFVHFVCCGALSIVPADVYGDGTADVNRYPVGTGPFRMIRGDESVIVLEAFTNYFGERAHLDRVELWLLSDKEAQAETRSWMHNMGMVVDHRTGKADGASEWEQLENVEFGCSLITYNTNKRGPLQNKKFRDAINRSIDRLQMMRDLGGNRVAPAHGFYPEWDQSEDNGTNEERPSPDELAALIRSTGYHNETLRIYTYDKHEEDANWIQANLARIGVAAETVVLPSGDITKVERIREADMIIYQIVSERNLALFLLDLFQLPNSFIRAHADRKFQESFDSIAASALSEPDENRRHKHIIDLEETAVREVLVGFLHHKKLTAAYHPSMRGVTFSGFGWVDLKNVWYYPAAESEVHP